MNHTQSPTTATAPPNRTSVPPYQAPASPEQVAREQERINLLLDLNNDILEHVNTMQVEGQGGIIGQPGMAPQMKQASPEYISCMKAIQCNVAWVACAVQGGGTNGKTSYGPLVMDAPLRVPSILEKYETLRGLFPGWKGAQQGVQRQLSTGTPPQNQGQQQQGTLQMSTQLRPPSTMQPMMQQQPQKAVPQQPQLSQGMGTGT